VVQSQKRSHLVIAEDLFLSVLQQCSGDAAIFPTVTVLSLECEISCCFIMCICMCVSACVHACTAV
jgi:hypothetical protein